MDSLTEVLRNVIVPLGARHKERLGMGIAVGLVILFIHSSLVAGELLPDVSAPISATGSIALGVVIMFVSVWLHPKQRHIGEDEQQILTLMDELSRRSGISVVQKKIAYQRMLNKLIDHYDPSKPSEIEKDVDAAIWEAALDNREVSEDGDTQANSDHYEPSKTSEIEKERSRVEIRRAQH